jgi:hypothetical protein
MGRLSNGSIDGKGSWTGRPRNERSCPQIFRVEMMRKLSRRSFYDSHIVFRKAFNSHIERIKKWNILIFITVIYILRCVSCPFSDNVTRTTVVDLR